MNVIPIRCPHALMSIYFESIRRQTGKSVREIIGNDEFPRNREWNETNKLTEIRELLVERGYEKEVEIADNEFLVERLKGLSQLEWERFWTWYIFEFPVVPYPVEAL